MCGGVEQVLTKSFISVEVCRPRNLKEERFTFYDGIDMITPWCAGLLFIFSLSFVQLLQTRC